MALTDYLLIRRSPVPDRRRAIEEIFDGEYPLSNFCEDWRGEITVAEAIDAASPSYSPFLPSGSLHGATQEEVREALVAKKERKWSDKALSWLSGSFPAIVFVRIQSGATPVYLLGDGHHRLALAAAIGRTKIHAVYVGLRKPR